MEVPAIYDSIMDAGEKTPEEKYKATYDGALPTDVATLAQASHFLGEMRSTHLQRGRPYKEPRIVALSLSGMTSRYIDSSVLIADNFPMDVPIRLQYVHDYGNRIADPEPVMARPDFTDQARVNEVRDLVYTYYANPNGPDMVYELIKQ